MLGSLIFVSPLWAEDKKFQPSAYAYHGDPSSRKGLLSCSSPAILLVSSEEAALIDKPASSGALFKITWKCYCFYTAIITGKQNGCFFFLFSKTCCWQLQFQKHKVERKKKPTWKLKMKGKIRFLLKAHPLQVSAALMREGGSGWFSMPIVTVIKGHNKQLNSLRLNCKIIFQVASPSVIT